MHTIDDHVTLAFTLKGNLLSLGYLCLSDQDVRDICEALKTNPNVTEFNLNNNELTNDAAYSIATLILDPNSHITKIDLSNNKMGRDGIDAIEQAIQKSGKTIDIDVSDNNPSFRKR